MYLPYSRKIWWGISMYLYQLLQFFLFPHQHTRVHTNTHTLVHTNTYTRTHTCTHTHTLAHTCTYIPVKLMSRKTLETRPSRQAATQKLCSCTAKPLPCVLSLQEQSMLSTIGTLYCQELKFYFRIAWK